MSSENSWSGVRRGPAAARRVDPAHRHQGPPAQHQPGRGQAVLHQPRLDRPRRPDRPPGGLQRHLDRRRGVPRVPAAAQRVRGLDAAAGGGGLPQGRRPDRRDGRHLPGRPGGRGRRRLRRPDLLAAARGGPARPGLLVRAPPGVRRPERPERRPVLRRPAPGLAAHRRRPRGAPRRRGRGPGRPGHARALGVRRPGRRGADPGRAGLRVRRDHHPARAGPSRRCARTAGSPSRSPGSRWSGTGTSRASRSVPATR